MLEQSTTKMDKPSEAILIPAEYDWESKCYLLPNEDLLLNEAVDPAEVNNVFEQLEQAVEKLLLEVNVSYKKKFCIQGILVLVTLVACNLFWFFISEKKYFYIMAVIGVFATIVIEGFFRWFVFQRFENRGFQTIHSVLMLINLDDPCLVWRIKKFRINSIELLLELKAGQTTVELFDRTANPNSTFWNRTGRSFITKRHKNVMTRKSEYFHNEGIL